MSGFVYMKEPTKEKVGNCFEAAMQFALDNSPLRHELRIIHANVTATTGGKSKFTHAWCELRGLVIDTSNMRRFTFVADRDAFYKMANVDEASVRSYTFEEALLNGAVTQSTGPWEERSGDATIKDGKKIIIP